MMMASNTKYSVLAQTIEPKSPDFLFKVIVVGDSGVGKSCLLLKYVDNCFSDCFIATIGVDFRFKELQNSDGKIIKLQIWDTAGQDRFRNITSNYFRGSHCVLLCADVTDRNSFDHLSFWMEEVTRSNANNKIVGCVLGTKCDLTNQRVVSVSEAKEYSKKVGLEYLETSSKTGDGVELAFEQLIPNMIERKISDHQKHLSQLPKLAKPLKYKTGFFSSFCNIL